MFFATLLWVPFTVLAAASQTARNAMQRELTATLGTVGATHVRFLFGFPFAVAFLVAVFVGTGASVPAIPAVYWPWVALGAGAQIVATALMLAAMNDRSFVVTIAYIKTEAIQAALFGLLFLGDRLTLGMVGALLVAWINSTGLPAFGDLVNNTFNTSIKFPSYNFLLFGGALVLMMLFRREGLIPESRLKAILHEDDESAPEIGGAE